MTDLKQEEENSVVVLVLSKNLEVAKTIKREIHRNFAGEFQVQDSEEPDGYPAGSEQQENDMDHIVSLDPVIILGVIEDKNGSLIRKSLDTGDPAKVIF